MINYLQWCRLKELAARDRLSAAQIARALGLAARTVRKWLKEPYRLRKRVQRASVLDSFKGQIMGMLKEHPYSAVQVLTMLHDQGFTGNNGLPFLIFAYRLYANSIFFLNELKYF